MKKAIITILIISTGLLLHCVSANGVPTRVGDDPCYYPAMFVFGDSLSDTGNGFLSGNPFFARTAQRPYGETFPHHPFLRFSDGLLFIDFLATRLGLPLLKPFLDILADFSKGVNYAVSGATALNVSFLGTRSIYPLTNISLDEQIRWHLALKASIPHQQNPTTLAYKKGLYVLEIGGNDYIAAINSQIYSPLEVASNFVPLVIAKIKNATQVLYANGARNFLYTSISPLGCLPLFLAAFPSNTRDRNGCLQDLNTLSYIHGLELLKLVKELSVVYSDAEFTLLDVYGAYTEIIEHSAIYGFSDTLDACCGAGPAYPYRFNIALFCNEQSNIFNSTLCPIPGAFIYWDGIHFTHHFNFQIFELTINKGFYLYPSNPFRTCTPAYP